MDDQPAPPTSEKIQTAYSLARKGIRAIRTRNTYGNSNDDDTTSLLVPDFAEGGFVQNYDTQPEKTAFEGLDDGDDGGSPKSSPIKGAQLTDDVGVGGEDEGGDWQMKIATEGLDVEGESTSGITKVQNTTRIMHFIDKVYSEIAPADVQVRRAKSFQIPLPAILFDTPHNIVTLMSNSPLQYLTKKPRDKTTPSNKFSTISQNLSTKEFYSMLESAMSLVAPLSKSVRKSIVRARLTVLIKGADTPRYHLMEIEGDGYDASGNPWEGLIETAERTTIGTKFGKATSVPPSPQRPEQHSEPSVLESSSGSTAPALPGQFAPSAASPSSSTFPSSPDRKTNETKAGRKERKLREKMERREEKKRLRADRKKREREAREAMEIETANGDIEDGITNVDDDEEYDPRESVEGSTSDSDDALLVAKIATKTRMLTPSFVRGDGVVEDKFVVASDLVKYGVARDTEGRIIAESTRKVKKGEENLVNTRLQKVKKVEQVVNEEMKAIEEEKDDDMTEEDRSRAEKISQLFNTNTEERVLRAEADHDNLLQNLRKKHEPLKIQLRREATEEYERLKAEQRKHKEEEKKEEERNKPILGRAQKVTDDDGIVKLDLDLDSESGSESEDVSDDEDNVEETSYNDEGPSVKDELSVAAVANAVATNVAAQTTKTLVTTSAVRRPILRPLTRTGRAGLKSTLVSSARRLGNQWLANGLDYDNWEEHVRDCHLQEIKKRKQAEKEEDRERKLKEEREKLGSDFEDEAEGAGEGGKLDEEEIAMRRLEKDKFEDQEDSSDDDCVDDDGNGAKEHQEDREICLNVLLNIVAGVEKNVKKADIIKVKRGFTPLSMFDNAAQARPLNDSMMVDYDDGESNKGASQAIEPLPQSNSQKELPLTESFDHDDTDWKANQPTSSAPPSLVAASVSSLARSPVEGGLGLSTDNAENCENAENGENSSEALQEPHPAQPQKPKNSAYIEMLLRDQEKAMKMKKAGKNSLVEEEASEEEEEDAVTGLEDFGFGSGKKKDDEDDDVDKITKDDLENIVDTFSDDEGDEEEALRNRIETEAAEDKSRHKEMMKLMKEGYTGARGSSGAAARGSRGWDALVAAEGTKDAKRLGLLNSDEENSDEEEASSSEEEEDEVALLDRILKERHNMGKKNIVEELVGSDLEDDGDDGDDGDEDDEDLDAEEMREKDEQRKEQRDNDNAKKARLMRKILAMNPAERKKKFEQKGLTSNIDLSILDAFDEGSQLDNSRLEDFIDRSKLSVSDEQERAFDDKNRKRRIAAINGSSLLDEINYLPSLKRRTSSKLVASSNSVSSNLVTSTSAYPSGNSIFADVQAEFKKSTSSSSRPLIVAENLPPKRNNSTGSSSLLSRSRKIKSSKANFFSDENQSDSASLSRSVSASSGGTAAGRSTNHVLFQVGDNSVSQFGNGWEDHERRERDGGEQYSSDKSFKLTHGSKSNSNKVTPEGLVGGKRKQQSKEKSQSLWASVGANRFR